MTVRGYDVSEVWSLTLVNAIVYLRYNIIRTLRWLACSGTLLILHTLAFARRDFHFVSALPIHQALLLFCALYKVVSLRVFCL